MALRSVNLIPEAVLQRRYALRHGIGWAILYGAAASLLLGSAFIYSHRILPRQHHTQNETAIRKQLSHTIADIETRKDELARLALVREVAYPIGPASILRDLSKAIETEAWLTQLSLSTAPTRGADLTIEGLAHSNSSLGGIMRNLNGSDRFTDVVLGSSSEQSFFTSPDQAPLRMVKFRIRVKVERGNSREI
jgi:Tfp pilus assembly protein PilN